MKLSVFLALLSLLACKPQEKIQPRQKIDRQQPISHDFAVNHSKIADNSLRLISPEELAQIVAEAANLHEIEYRLKNLYEDQRVNPLGHLHTIEVKEKSSSEAVFIEVYLLERNIDAKNGHSARHLLFVIKFSIESDDGCIFMSINGESMPPLCRENSSFHQYLVAKHQKSFFSDPAAAAILGGAAAGAVGGAAAGAVYQRYGGGARVRYRSRSNSDDSASSKSTSKSESRSSPDARSRGGGGK